MPKKLLKKLFPNQELIKQHKSLQFLGSALHDPNLWHLNRRSVSGAFAVGLFMAFMPIPLQMVAAAVVAIIVRVNLPISVMLVWLTNPVTMGPVFYFAYKLGQFILQAPPIAFDGDLGVHWFEHNIEVIWQPMLLGSLIMGSFFALLGYIGMRIFWRLHVISRWKRTHCKRKSS